MTFLTSLAAVIWIVVTTPGASQRPNAPAPATPSATMLWYRAAAPQWDHALPLGNGRIGAMLFGSVSRERIQLNEETLWMGSPRDRDNPDALAALPEVRRLLFAGMPVEANALAEKKLMGRPSRLEPRSEEHTSELQSRPHLVC